LKKIFGKENNVMASELLALWNVKPSMLESFVDDAR
jgi:hypothetical protein